MDVREKLVKLLENHCAVIGEDNCKASQSGKCTPRDCAICLASDLISNGVTVQEWIPVTERLPEENEYVLIWCGECQIARIEKGISEEQRKAMKNGEINDPVESGWNMSDGYFRLKRSDSYKACDEGWNNKVPYCWRVNGGMMTLFGQNVTHWMPMPQPPKEE